MNRILVLIVCVLLRLTVSAGSGTSTRLIRILILTGKNNHEWQKTTPVLARIFSDPGHFEVHITRKPDTLSLNSMQQYDLLVSNWNTWPDPQLRMSDQWEHDFGRYVNEGGGVLFIHAGASSFYDWEDYHRIGIGRWGNETRHGAPTYGHVYNLDQYHPITKGLGDFYIYDEIWEHTEIYPGAKSIGQVSAKEAKDGHDIRVPAIFVNRNGKGRSFYTTLGHDERALLNTGLQILLQRAGQWCARRDVTIEIPGEIKSVQRKLPVKFNMVKTDTSFALMNHDEIIWQFNYNNRFGKPYFHPLTVSHIILTCVSPPDHPWHLGGWFSWKFINGINYWEYLEKFSSPETGYKSEGITGIEETRFVMNPDFSADISLKLNFRPVNGQPVLAELRDIHISTPQKDGSYYIDQQHHFTALDESVTLDRTPVMGETGGQPWGGYAGLSIRFNQNFIFPAITFPQDSMSIGKSNLMYWAFKGLKGDTCGIAILQHPDFTTRSMSWYKISEPEVPFYFISPAVLYNKRILLKKGESLDLKYRIWILPGIVSDEKLKQLSDQFIMSRSLR